MERPIPEVDASRTAGKSTALRSARAIFGFASDLNSRLRLLSNKDVLTHRSQPFGRLGAWHFDSRGIDIADSADQLVAVMGTLRSREGEPLHAASLLGQSWLTADGVEAERIRGSAWIAVFSKQEPRFCVYSTLMSMPQLYFTEVADGILCATDFEPLLQVRQQRTIDEEALPAHFLFRVVPGNRTFFHGIHRLFPGQLLTWKEDRARWRTIRDFRVSTPRHRQASPLAVQELDEEMVRTLRRVRRGWGEGRLGVNLLSGGEDSCLTQLWLDELQGDVQRGASPSCSFAIEARSFQFEIDYALDASRHLGTEHRLYEIAPKGYPDLVERAIDHLQQPALYNEGVPGFLALAEALRQEGGEGQVYIAGQAADALHGAYDLPQVIAYQRWRRVPWAESWLKLLAWFAMRRGKALKAEGLYDIAGMLGQPEGSGGLQSPECYIALAGDIDRCLRCFGEAAVRRAFESRIELEERYFGSVELLDRVQGMDFLTAGYDPGVAAASLFAAEGLDLFQFYLDEDVIRNVMTFEAGCRYQSSGRLKPLQKELLRRRGKKALTNKAKGGTQFSSDLWNWMQEGVLKDRVEAIDPHGFLDRDLTRELKREPGDFLWNLLIYDLFTKRIVHRTSIPH